MSPYSSTYARSINNPLGGLYFFVVVALILAVLTVILVTPEKRRAQLNSFFRILADICNFRNLFIESIFKFLYIFSTYSSILMGVYFFFKGLFDSYFGGEFIKMALVMIFIMPLLIRVVYEIFMLLIIAVKNIISINNKIKGSENEQPNKGTSPSFAAVASTITKAFSKEPAPAPAPAPVATSEPKFVFCANCGTKYDPTQGGCPNGCAE